ncbi:DinB family protein [Tamlana crocina]
MGSKYFNILNKQLTQIEAHIPHYQLTVKKVSKSNIGWHLSHVLMVINGVCGILAKTKPENYKRDFNIKRTIIFPLGYMPRGMGKAPKVVVPTKAITAEDLEEQLNFARKQVKATKELPEKAYFIHHIFGMLNKKQTLHFLTIHTNHHLKIVRDILKRENSLRNTERV